MSSVGRDFFVFFFDFFFFERTRPVVPGKYEAAFCLIYLSTSNEARPRERSDRGHFLPLGKKKKSYRGAYRAPSFNLPVGMCVRVCDIEFIVFTVRQSCTRPISTN